VTEINIPLALTYDDVLLVPQHSNVTSRNQVSLKTKITPSIEANLPIGPTNMDSSTGVAMAIAADKLGSIALYPRFKGNEVVLSEVKDILAAGANVIPSIGI
jgi:IMP dehydrogenase